MNHDSIREHHTATIDISDFWGTTTACVNMILIRTAAEYMFRRATTKVHVHSKIPLLLFIRNEVPSQKVHPSRFAYRSVRE